MKDQTGEFVSSVKSDLNCMKAELVGSWARRAQEVSAAKIGKMSYALDNKRKSAQDYRRHGRG